MAIGRKSIEELLKYMNPKWKTSITKVEPNRIITRGYLQQDLIGNLSFPEMVYLLMQGNKPHENESKMLEAMVPLPLAPRWPGSWHPLDLPLTPVYPGV